MRFPTRKLLSAWPLLVAAAFLLPYAWLLQASQNAPATGNLVPERLAGTLRNTAAFATLSAAIAFAIGALGGLATVGARPFFRRILLALALSILAVPAYVHTVGFAAAGASAPLLDRLLFSFQGAALVQGWVLSPFVFLAVYAASRGWPHEWEEVALLETSPWGVLWRVRARAALPPAIAGAGVAWLLAFGRLPVPDVLFARDPAALRLVSTEIQLLIGGRYDFDGARHLAAAALPIPLAVLASLAALVALRSRSAPLDVPLLDRPPGNAAARGHAGVALIRSLAVPALAAPWLLSGAGLLRDLLRDPAALGEIWGSARDELLYSLALTSACAAATVALGLALLGAMAVSRTRRRLTAFCLAVCAMPFLLPDAILGLSLLDAFGKPPLLALRDTSLPLALNYLLIGPALAWPLLALAHATTPSDLLDAARLDGCGAAGMLLHVFAPICGGAWVAALGLALLIFLAEAGGAMLVCAPGKTPLAVRILTVMHYGPGTYVAALCLLAAATALAVLVLTAAALEMTWRPAGRPSIGTNPKDSPNLPGRNRSYDRLP